MVESMKNHLKQTNPKKRNRPVAPIFPPTVVSPTDHVETCSGDVARLRPSLEGEKQAQNGHVSLT